MAPWPEQGNEPKAPDKVCSKNSDSSASDLSKVNSGTTEDLEAKDPTNKSDDKQPEEKNPDVSNLDDGQLKALLDEAITYKRPKDREGKSDLFRELLQEAEADEIQCGDGRRGGTGGVQEQVVQASSSRYYNNNRRRGRRDTAVSERQTRGGSLQNLVHAFSSEFDTSGFGYFGQSSGHSGGIGRRKSKRSNSGRDFGVSVSARQREGGSLPSNVNVGGAGGGMLTLSELEFPPTAPLSSAATAALLFDDTRAYINRQNKQRKELGHTLSSNEFSTTMPVHSSSSVSYQTGGETSNNALKTEFMVVDLEDLGENGQESKTNCVVVGDSAMDGGSGKGSLNGSEGGKLLVGDICNNGLEDELGTEMEVIQRSEATRVPNYTSRATLEVGHGDCHAKNKNLTENIGEVDTTVQFPLGIMQCEKSGGVVNGMEQNPLQLGSSYNSVKCIVGSGNSTNREERNSNVNKGDDDDDMQAENKKHRSGRKHLDGGSSLIESSDDHVYENIPLSHWRNLYGFAFVDFGETVNRLTFHGSKETGIDGKNKSLDENGNAVNQNYRSESMNSNDRKSKLRRAKTNNDRNVIMSHNIEGYRGDKDIESLVKFIESNSETKGKTKNNSTHSNGPVSFNNKRNNLRRDEVVAGTKTRRDKAFDDSHDEEKISIKNREGGKQNPKEHRHSGKVGNRLKKSNSLEEFSKTKLEDLTAVRIGSNSTSSASSSSSAQVNLRRPKKQSTLDDEELFSEKNRAPDRRSWGTEDGQLYYCNDGTATVSADESGSISVGGRKRRAIVDEKRKLDDGVPVVVSNNMSEETDFLVVKTKKGRKKRRSSSGGRTSSTAGGSGLFGEENRRSGSHYGHYYQNRGETPGYYQRKGLTSTGGNGFPPHDRMVEREGVLYQYRHHRPRSPEHHRRKSTSSMPPSDKSDSSDLDSVHSLPPSLSSTPKLNLDQTSTSSGSTPQASYADITRMASSNASSSSSTQGSCSMNTGKWPTVTLNKNQSSSTMATTPSTSISTYTTTTTTTTITTTTTATTCSTYSSTTNPNSTTSTSIITNVNLVTSAAALPLNNPQFIIGPKINIGVPPVSGSKVTATTTYNPLSNTMSISSSNAVSSVPPTLVTTGDTLISAPLGHSQTESVSDSVLSSRQKNNSSCDLRPKKDAMTSTTLDCKIIPNEDHNQSQKLNANTNQVTEFQSSPPSVIMDNYYPSLEESLVEKLDRKSIRCNHNLASHNATSNTLLAEENSSTTVVSSDVNSLYLENNKGSRHQDVSGDTRVRHQHVDMSVETTVIVTRSNVCSAAELVPSVPVASAVMNISNTNRSKETISRSKIVGKKVSAAGSNSLTPSARPPVIIMDEQEQESSFRENVGTLSELTFGFEVNEQLLLSDCDESLCSTSAEPPSVVNETTIDTNPITGSITSDTQLSEETKIVVSITTTSASEDFSARYREPVTQQAENHDSIVTYVGRAWDDVLKEMTAASVQASGKVQYYSGQ